MIKTVIIDDEINAIEVLEILLKKNFNDIDIIATFTSSKEALEFLKNQYVDLVFLDIQMPFMSGIDLLEKLDRYNFHVVFTTAFDQYAIKAIKLSALDYILKPIDDELLTKAIEKYKKARKNQDMKEQISNLLQLYAGSTLGSPQPNVTPMHHHSNKISISFQDKILFYDTDEIIYCQSNDNYTAIQLKNGEKIIASKTMKYFEDLLIPNGFLRPHQSYIVNTKYIEQYNKKDGGSLLMSDGSSIPVSRHKKEEILSLFKSEM